MFNTQPRWSAGIFNIGKTSIRNHASSQTQGDQKQSWNWRHEKRPCKLTNLNAQWTTNCPCLCVNLLKWISFDVDPRRNSFVRIFFLAWKRSMFAWIRLNLTHFEGYMYVQTNGKAGHSFLFGFIHRREITVTITIFQLIKKQFLVDSPGSIFLMMWFTFSPAFGALLVLLPLFSSRTRSILLRPFSNVSFHHPNIRSLQVLFLLCIYNVFLIFRNTIVNIWLSSLLFVRLIRACHIY